MRRIAGALAVLAGCVSAGAEPPAKAPTTVEELWADYDPRREPIEARTVRQWGQDGLVVRYVTYTVGTYKGTKARMAGLYAFPKGARKLPALLHLHGGGQRAFLHEVLYHAGRGYACLSINWGGKGLPEARAGEPNTDWGAVDPTQKNVPGYFNLKPGPGYLDPGVSPRNNNWYLLTIAARRGLTFLERQREVDPSRLGVYGLSMGGNLTMYVAGTDERVRVAVPSVGGAGFRTRPWPLLPAHRPRDYGGLAEAFRRTLDFEVYAPRIRAALLQLSATNDFHAIMDNVHRTGALVSHDRVRTSLAPHLNHRSTPPFAITGPLWIDQHLKGTFTMARTPQTRLALATANRIPRLVVRPDTSQEIRQVAVYYAVDADPRARFWRSADVHRDANQWWGELPILDANQPLFAFANVHYALDRPRKTLHGQADRYALSSALHTAAPSALAEARVRATDRPSPVLEDFRHGWRDWYVLSGGNPHHWQYWTRKVTDPKWRGPAGASLRLDVRSPRDNKLVVVLVENEWRRYRGRRRTYAAVVSLPGRSGWQTVRLGAADFRDAATGKHLPSWGQLDLLGLVGRWDARKGEAASRLGGNWQGPPPAFRLLRWEAGR